MSKIYKLIVFISLSVLLYSCSGSVPLTIGEFRSCPDKPNCISSKNSNVQNYIEPIYYKGSLNSAKIDLLLAIKSFDSARVKKELDQFIHVEFTSNIFKFIDDVEFYLIEPGVIHFRSASRIGYSDLGVNRKRMNRILLAFNKRNKKQESEVLKD
jgi:uncharacterized protein (DUF1499 family)